MKRLVEVWDRKFREVLDEHCPVKSIYTRGNRGKIM